MNLSPRQTLNRPRACGVWVEETRLVLEPGAQVRGEGLLRSLRRRAAGVAVWLALAFTVYCTKPSAAPRRRSGPPAPTAASAGDAPYEESGESSWYGGNGDGFAGKPTASGEPFDPGALTCAHRTLPLGSLVEVEHLGTGKKAVLRVNDRGPFARGRILDVSRRAARDLGFLGQGTAEVRIRSVDAEGRPAPLDPDLDARDPYTVQVAALSDPGNLQRLSRELEDAFGPVSIQEILTFDGRTVKRVRVGNYTRFSDAQRAADQIQRRLKERGVEPFITRRR